MDKWFLLALFSTLDGTRLKGGAFRVSMELGPISLIYINLRLEGESYMATVGGEKKETGPWKDQSPSCLPASGAVEQRS